MNKIEETIDNIKKTLENENVKGNFRISLKKKLRDLEKNIVLK